MHAGYSIPIAQVIGITSSAFLAGSTAGYTIPLIPAITSSQHGLAPDPKTLLSQWRTAYVVGYKVTPPQSILATLPFAFLAYTARATPGVRNMYALAAVLVGSLLPYTFTVQRYINGALSLRAEKLAGPGYGTQAERLAQGEDRTVELEQREDMDTERLVWLFGYSNACRAVLVAAGAVVGAWTSLHASTGGVPLRT